jgi:type VII secretion protein EccB
MASRRDQLQSYQFMVRRVVSALVLRETDPVQSPFRRLAGAAMGGVMVAVIALAAVGIYGLLRPAGNQSWRTDKAIIMEKETSTQYVLLGGKLHPVANYASARLIIGSGATVVRVSANSLVDVPRGPKMGIPGAPDSLPDPKRILGAPWSLCSQVSRDDADQNRVTSVLIVGQQAAGGRDLGDEAFLASDQRQQTYLVWRNHRYAIKDSKVLVALNLAGGQRTDVGGAWIDQLPAGQDIDLPVIVGRGQRSTAVPGRNDFTVGQVLAQQRPDGGRQYYAVEPQALRLITEFAALLQLTATGAQEAVAIDGATVATAKRVPDADTTAEQPPPTVPRIAEIRDPANGVCIAISGAADTPKVTVGADRIDADDGATTPVRTGTGGQLADFVMVRPGWGAVVESVESAATTANTGTYYLITDDGKRYALADRGVMGLLGYSESTPIRMLSSMVDRLPAGPALSQETASQPVGAS